MLPTLKKLTDDELDKASYESGDNRMFWRSIIESQRRVRVSNTHLTWVNLALTAMAVIFAAMQVWLAFRHHG